MRPASLHAHDVIVRPFGSLIDPIIMGWRLALADALGAVDDGDTLYLFGDARRGRVAAAEITTGEAALCGDFALHLPMAFTLRVADRQLAHGSVELRFGAAHYQRLITIVELFGDFCWSADRFERHRTLGKPRVAAQATIANYFRLYLATLRSCAVSTT